jgi:hypothetical protein
VVNWGQMKPSCLGQLSCYCHTVSTGPTASEFKAAAQASWSKGARGSTPVDGAKPANLCGSLQLCAM